jgi:transcriptional regulator with XRE-family HTH domain
VEHLKLPEIMTTDEINMFYKNVGYNIKQLRKAKKISQLEMALSIGHTSVSFYVNAENAIRNKRFNLEHLAKIAKVLNIDICEFFKPKS